MAGCDFSRKIDKKIHINYRKKLTLNGKESLTDKRESRLANIEQEQKTRRIAAKQRDWLLTCPASRIGTQKSGCGFMVVFHWASLPSFDVGVACPGLLTTLSTCV